MKKILPKIYLLFTMLLIIVALMGCSDKDRSVVNDEKRILTIGVASETTLLSPLYMDSMNYSTTQLVYENLLNYENGEIKPGLAESWDFENDGKDLILHIRKNIKLHNGEELTADIVKKNLEHKKVIPAFIH